MSTDAAVKHRDEFAETTLGFWVYLMTDCVLFASLFASFAVLRGGTANGPSGAEIFDLNFVLIETMLLLTSSLTSGLALVGLRTGSRRFVGVMLGLTFLLGAAFLGLELHEFSALVGEGNGWQTSAFLSSYFTLVGTHGLHIAVGLLWILVLTYSLFSRGISNQFHKRLALFSMFWHFLDIIWIFIFTIVYLLGAIT